MARLDLQVVWMRMVLPDYVGIAAVPDPLQMLKALGGADAAPLYLRGHS